MKNYNFATTVTKTLEHDIMQCLIDTDHSNIDSVELHNQSVEMYPRLKYRGTFKVVMGEEFMLGEFRAATNNFGLSTNPFNNRPLYNLVLNYDGEHIVAPGRLFNSKYVRTPLCNP